ncbi:MAG: HEPN domain-containing protein [bacterium]
MKKDRELIERWLDFAYSDLKAIEPLIKEEIYHLACFHAQQSVEKSLKVFLLFKTNRVNRIHSLNKLLLECLKYESFLLKYKKDCLNLDRYYQPTRYPDALPGSLPEGLPNKQDAKESFEIADDIYWAVKNFLSEKL